jgi:hypothetical protein
MRKILRGLLFLAKAYLIAAGLITTVLVAQRMYLDHLNPTHEVKVRINLKLPDMKANIGGAKDENKK